MRLSELKTGDSAVILKVLGHGAFRKRIMEMGFVRGKTVTVELNAPLKDPVKYKIMDYEVSLRRSEAAMIEVITEEEAELAAKEDNGGGQSNITEDYVKRAVTKSTKQINVALVGNPNSGKTSFFNAASGSHEHVGNYGGVTVDAKRGSFTHRGYEFIIYDLPGTYALSAYSPEEKYVRRHLIEHTPDVVINIVAASNLERNLYLTTDLIDMDCPTVMALNMYDELERSGAKLDYKMLGEMLGIPVVPTVSRSGKGMKPLFNTIISLYENRINPKHIHISHGQEIEEGIETLEKRLKADGSIQEHFSTRFLATKLLEGDREIQKLLSGEKKYPQWAEVRDRLVEHIERINGEDIETSLTNDKYGFISGALMETYEPGESEQMRKTQLIDLFVTNKLFGFPFFLLLMFVMFWSTFVIGSYPMGWIEDGVGLLGNWLGDTMPGGMLKDLITDGIIGGVGSVIVFLPNILILYLFISFMEDSGYMARAAFIMDRLMRRMGLHGKSFIPLIMGFGCNVPAIMATRSIESHSSRIITILINPFMSCGARLPVYIMLTAAFFPDTTAATLICVGLYLLGITVAVITAKLLRKFKFKKDETPFVMELPPYRIPTARATIGHMWEKAAQYLRKMGGIILVASIAIWFLSYFPRYESDAHQTGTAEAITDSIDFPAVVSGEAPAVASGGEPTGETREDPKSVNTGTVPAGSVIAILPAAQPSEQTPEYEALANYMQQRNSYIGRVGRFISPVMEPLGFEWKTSVALVTGMAAKELIVSTLGVLHSEGGEPSDTRLAVRLKSPDPITGEPGMTPLSALSLLVFVLLYFPCIAAVVAISRETGSWKWGLFSFVYNTAVAWVVSFIVYNAGSLFI